MSYETLEDCQEEVGKGWRKLVEECWNICQSISPPLEVVQVKEKFGGLRFYTGALSSSQDINTWDRIHDVEARSLLTCEFCGARGDLVSLRGWMKTLCPVCEDAANAKFKADVDIAGPIS